MGLDLITSCSLHSNWSSVAIDPSVRLDSVLHRFCVYSLLSNSKVSETVEIRSIFIVAALGGVRKLHKQKIT